MEFYEFAQLLHPIIGAGSSTDKFVRSIFEAILSDNGQDILEEYKSSSYKAFFNGNTRITKLAKKINAYVEPTGFSSYIDEFSDSAIQNLCDDFKKYLPDIYPRNASDKLADFFADIIKAAASKKRGTTKGAKKEVQSAHSILENNILASASVVADEWNSALEKLSEHSESSERIETEVMDDEELSGSTEEKPKSETNVQIVEKATVVNQYGENCFHIDHVDTFKL